MHRTAIFQRPVGRLGRARRSEWPGICIAALLGATIGAAGATSFFVQREETTGTMPTIRRTTEPACEMPLPAPTPVRRTDTLL